MRCASASVMGRAAAAAEKAGDLRRVLDQMPAFVGQIHLDKDIAGEEFAFGIDLGAAADFDHFLGRHQNFRKGFFQDPF